MTVMGDKCLLGEDLGGALICEISRGIPKNLEIEAKALLGKAKTHFRNLKTLFGKPKTVFRKRKTLFRPAKTFSRKPKTLFRKGKPVFRKRETLSGKGLARKGINNP